MFAIKLTEDNFPKILLTPTLSIAKAQAISELYFHRNYIFVAGYVDHFGRVTGWDIIPEFVFKKFFDYDPEKIKTDWDQIVRL